MDDVTLFDAEVVCGCGRRYGIFNFVHLRLVGVQDVPAGSDGPAHWLELRQCACYSVCARIIGEERAAWLKHRGAHTKLMVAIETQKGMREAFRVERHAWADWMEIARASFRAAQPADGRRAA